MKAEGKTVGRETHLVHNWLVFACTASGLGCCLRSALGWLPGQSHEPAGLPHRSTAAWGLIQQAKSGRVLATAGGAKSLVIALNATTELWHKVPLSWD